MPSVFVVHSSLRSLSQNTLCARNRLQRELGEENDINCTTEGAPGFVLPTRRKNSNQGLTATSERLIQLIICNIDGRHHRPFFSVK